MALSGLPQVIKIFQRKSAGDVSLLTYIIVTLGAVIWIWYGFDIKSTPLIISNIIGFCVTSSVIFACLKFGKKSQ